MHCEICNQSSALITSFHKKTGHKVCFFKETQESKVRIIEEKPNHLEMAYSCFIVNYLLDEQCRLDKRLFRLQRHGKSVVYILTEAFRIRHNHVITFNRLKYDRCHKLLIRLSNNYRKYTIKNHLNSKYRT